MGNRALDAPNALGEGGRGAWRPDLATRGHREGFDAFGLTLPPPVDSHGMRDTQPNRASVAHGWARLSMIDQRPNCETGRRAVDGPKPRHTTANSPKNHR
jgi:hypothetical protein